MEKAADPVKYPTYPVTEEIQQSRPVDLNAPCDAAWVKGRTIVITGGASGFGAGFVKKWAANGANIILGDISIDQAESLVRQVRGETGNPNVHFVYCNVTDWTSQVHFFQQAVKLSPTGGIDTVVANAGIAGVDQFEEPQDLDAPAPPKPNMKIIEVNLIGVCYTVHLALFWLPKNPGSSGINRSAFPGTSTRDRHILLLGSTAAIDPIPVQPLYAASKHGVMGLFRTIRGTSWVHGIRVNILCPYFIDTPILPPGARLVLAGGATGKPADVVEAATRFTADSRIVGRCLVIGPRMEVELNTDGEYQLAKPNPRSVQKSIWEAYAHDYEDTEIFRRNLIKLLNAYGRLRGWKGWILDVLKALMQAVRMGPRAFAGHIKR